MNVPTPETSNWNARLVAWFIKNTQLMLLLLISLILGGGISLFSLRTEGFPSPDINLAIITDTYKGASSAQVEQQIVKPLEVGIQAVRGVEEVRSTSNNSFAMLSVQFEAGTDFKAALTELRTKVQNVVLPKDADKPEISSPAVGGNQSFYALLGTNNRESLRSVGDNLKTAVEAISGVKEFKLLSDLHDQVEIRWRASDLEANAISLQQLQQVLATNNLSLPAGTITSSGQNQSVITTANLHSPAEIEALTLGQDAKGRLVHIKDVATVVSTVGSKDLVPVVGFKDQTKSGEAKSFPALLYALSLKSSADILKVDSAVQAAFHKAEGDHTLQGAKLITVFDAAGQVRKQVDEITSGAWGGKIGSGPFASAGYLLGGVWLVILVMLIFVNWRVALISALVIPFSLLFTLLSLKVMGISLNTLTLFSMILVLGLVVDPAIVVLEAIQRELDLGKPPKQAVRAALDSIGNGVFMAVLTSIIVFMPFGVVSGIFGQIIRYIPLTVIPALLASYFVPMIFLTYLAQFFLRPHRNAAQGGDELSHLWKLSRWIMHANQAILQKKWRQILIIIAALFIPLGITGYLFQKGYVTPVQFSAANDSERLNVQIEYLPYLSIAKKADLLRTIEPIIQKEVTVQSYFVMDQQGGSTTLVLNLLPRSMRDSDSGVIVSRLSDQLKSFIHPEVSQYITVKAEGIGPPNSAFPVAVTIYGDNLDDLKKAAITTGDLLRAQPKVTRVEDGFTGGGTPQIEVIIDREKIAQNNLSSLQVAQILSALVGQSVVTKYDQVIAGAERSVEVVLVNADQPTTPTSIAELTLFNTPAGALKVKDLAAVTQSKGFSGINHLNGSRYVTVQAQVKDSLKDAAAPQKVVTDFWTSQKLADYHLRPDALQNKGSSDQFIQSFKDLFSALAIAVLLTYIVLALFFGSFAQPFIILFSVPLSFIGVFPALAIIGGQFGFLEILGIITLVGIVENVGIFVIDLANRRRLAGTPYRQAISEASGIRFRPIFLTKVTALGGLLPLMILSPFWRSLAVVVVAGILTSGILSLFTTPILYSWFLEFNGWIKRITYLKRRS